MQPTIPPFGGDSRPMPPINPPASIGPYKVDALLETGGMSLLYLGIHPDSKHPIAIKVLSPKFVSHPEMTARFLKEAEIIALADHPNIVKLHGYGPWQGGLYIAMEFVQGSSLKEHLLRHPLSMKRALEITLEVAYAICHLHIHGVIHRDLKPENILIDDAGHVKVIDFGIAQLIEPFTEEKLAEESPGRLIGTPIYMSPEQKENPYTVSYPTDIYSLGIIAYELVLGKLSQGRIHLRLMPKGLQKILAKSLQPNPNERYHDVVDFIADLSTYFHSIEFNKEQSEGNPSGAWLEEIQSVQNICFPPLTSSDPRMTLGLSLKNNFGFKTAFTLLGDSFFIVAEPPRSNIEGMLQMIYFKGAVDASLQKETSIQEWVPRLHQFMLKSPFLSPLTCGFISWDFKKNTGSILSCGMGAPWKLNTSLELHPFQDQTARLGDPSLNRFTFNEFSLDSGDTWLFCPWTAHQTEASLSSFKDFLKENARLEAPLLANAVGLKGQSMNRRYFKERSLGSVVWRFIGNPEKFLPS